jgi:hypothetical protein
MSNTNENNKNADATIAMLKEEVSRRKAQVEALQHSANSWDNTIYAWTKTEFVNVVGADWLMRADPSDAWESYSRVVLRRGRHV